MRKFVIPKRVYMNGMKKMLSVRVPEELLSKLEALAKEKGWNVTDLILIVLDQMMQQEDAARKTKL